MPLTNFPYGISSFGIPLIGAGPVLTTGKVFFVDSATGVNAPGRGDDPSTPMASLAWAMANAVRSGKGDVVMIAPGHAENITAAATIACSKAQVTVIGLGAGASRPTFTWTTVATATITITAAGVTFVNCVFSGTGVDSVDVMIAVTAAYARFYDCLFQIGDATNQADIGVQLGTGGNNALFDNCQFISRTAGATSGISTAVAIDGLVVRNCYFNMDATAGIHNLTTANTNSLIERNSFYMLGSGKAIVLDAAATGVIRDNATFITANIAAGGSLTAAGAFKSNNLAQEAAGVASSAVLDPTSAAIT